MVNIILTCNAVCRFYLQLCACRPFITHLQLSNEIFMLISEDHLITQKTQLVVPQKCMWVPMKPLYLWVSTVPQWKGTQRSTTFNRNTILHHCSVTKTDSLLDKVISGAYFFLQMDCHWELMKIWTPIKIHVLTTQMFNCSVAYYIFFFLQSLLDIQCTLIPTKCQAKLPGHLSFCTSIMLCS